MIPRLLRALAAALLCLAHPGPAAGEEPLVFAVTGNTSPRSPFAGFNDHLPAVLERIAADNPLFVAHTGNMVQGGVYSMGVKKEDLDRQFGLFRAMTRRLPAPLYTLAGEKDLFNAGPDSYRAGTGRPLSYSFNTGKAHIVFFDTLFDAPALVAAKKRSWLERDLAAGTGKAPLVIFVHHCPFTVRSAEAFSWSGAFHALAAARGVTAVISGQGDIPYTVEKDGLRYLNIPCGPFFRGERCNGCGHYYLVTITGKTVASVRKIVPLR
jgi:3',5'-cyclic AMP phosphodiesterase CpdA